MLYHNISWQVLCAFSSGLSYITRRVHNVVIIISSPSLSIFRMQSPEVNRSTSVLQLTPKLSCSVITGSSGPYIQNPLKTTTPHDYPNYIESSRWEAEPKSWRCSFNSEVNAPKLYRHSKIILYGYWLRYMLQNTCFF